ncbi:diguanylate cyclase [Couchioplanes caeruleus]
MTVSTVSRDRTVERLDHAATTVRSAMGALCGQLQAVADAVAVLPEDARRPAADQMVTRGLAAEVRIVSPAPSAGSGPGTSLPSRISQPGEGQPGERQGAVGQGAAEQAVAGQGAVGQGAAEQGLAEQGTARPGAAEQSAAEQSAGGEGEAAKGEDRAVELDGGESRAEERDCAGPPAAPAPGATITAVTASAVGGDVAVIALARTDEDFIHRLAHTSGATVDLERSGGAARGTGTRGHSGTAMRTIAGGPGQPLPLVVSVPARTPFPLYALLAAAVVLVAGIAIVVARWLARSTTRPLEELAWAAGKVADGELGVRVPVQRDDEIGRLARTFNRMTRELQAYVQALTASRDQLRGHLAILGDTLSSTHDLDRILRVILRTALSASGARAGIVLLTDPAGGDLVARCAEGLTGRWDVPDDELASLRVPRGRGILGAVAAGGEPRRGFCGLGGGVVDEPACRTYVAVPICAPATVGDPLVPGEWDTVGHPATLGVLALYDRLGTDEFDDADLLMLRTFAGQAGVAVHNVRMHEEAQRLSLTDPLTGLWNYRYLRESLRREVERANRFGRMLTVLVLDLDHFKEVNDTYGHAAGDAVLGEFARRVRVGLREVDVAFRQGGEEFVVLLPETDAYGGIIVAERLGAAVRDQPVLIDDRRSGSGGAVERVSISVSIGIAVYPEHGTTADRVLAAADDALYAAKNAGRDTYRLAETAAGMKRPAGNAATPAEPTQVGDTGAPVEPTQMGGVRAPAEPTLTGGGVGIPAEAALATGAAGISAESGAPVTQASVSGGVDEGQFDHPESMPGASGGPQPPRQSRGR